MLRTVFLIIFISCHIWICCHSRRRDFRPSNAEIGFTRPSSVFVIPATFTTTTNYIVRVGSSIDGTANAAACSSSSSVALSTCNLRSAWALCQSLITAMTCPSSGSPSILLLTCSVVLPGTSTLQMMKAYGSNGLDVTGLTTWASSCHNVQVSLSIAASTSSRPATIAGDSTSAPLLNLQGIPFIGLTMENMTVTGFGDGTFLLSYIILYYLSPKTDYDVHSTRFDWISWSCITYIHTECSFCSYASRPFKRGLF